MKNTNENSRRFRDSAIFVFANYYSDWYVMNKINKIIRGNISFYNLRTKPLLLEI